MSAARPTRFTGSFGSIAAGSMSYGRTAGRRDPTYTIPSLNERPATLNCLPGGIQQSTDDSFVSGCSPDLPYVARMVIKGADFEDAVGSTRELVASLLPALLSAYTRKPSTAMTPRPI